MTNVTLCPGQVTTTVQGMTSPAETFLASQPAEVRKYVEEMATERIRNLPPVAAKVELDLRQARLKLRPYWEVANDVLRERGILKQYQDADVRACCVGKRVATNENINSGLFELLAS